jgi:hypothetical protein
MRFEFCRRVFEKYTNIKFYDNTSIGSRVVPRGRMYGQTDMTKLIFAFRKFAKERLINAGMCGCFVNMCNYVYCLLYFLYCVFCIVSFMYIYFYLFCLY